VGSLLAEDIASPACLFGKSGRFLRSDGDLLYLVEVAPGEVLVLLVFAPVVTTGHPGANAGRPRPRVKGWLLPDGVDLQGAGTAIDQYVAAALDVHLVAAVTPLALGHDTAPEADLALHSLAIQLGTVGCFAQDVGCLVLSRWRRLGRPKSRPGLGF
jgi:hypothetical protein